MEQDKNEFGGGVDNRPAGNNSENNTVMAVLSYIGPLVIVSYILGRENPFVKFHVKQGLVLFGIEIVIWFLFSMMLWQSIMLLQMINLAMLVLVVIGIVNAVQGKEKPLPIVGQFAKMIKI